MERKEDRDKRERDTHTHTDRYRDVFEWHDIK